MKKITLLSIMLFIAFIYQVQGQVLVDYETPGTSSSFGSWGSAGFAQIVNPDQTGLNTSANVGEFTHDGSSGYIGIESAGPFSNFDFTATPTFKMKVWVDEPVEIIFKLQNDPNWWESKEVKYQVGAGETNQWIQLEFNFEDATATNYNRVVLYFDGGNTIPSGVGHKYYFDDIEKSATLLPPTCTDGIMNGDEIDIDCGGTTCAPCPPKLTDFSFDFDTVTPLEGAESATFNDDAINTVLNGINPTANVGELSGINLSWWSQLKYQYDDGVDLSTGDRGFSMKVKGPRALSVTIKVEGSVEHSVAVDYTTPNVWQKLDFDFSSFTSNTNTKIAVFFGIQEDDTAFPDPNDNVFQVDDFIFGVFASLSTKDFKIEGLTIYPNPTTASWAISTKNQVIKSIEVYSILGKRVQTLKPNTLNTQVDASSLAPGIYITNITTELGTESRRLIKQ
ncbi:MAG: T9SS type A sorting domain-containing protein [Algibacter sp.]|uniref:T9SS type A sorting domain-containing protein n=1 Tax=Algibacter sp. TaxID=1872428 RepID=UPI002604F28F|nr:T9SS type A sorting domain-containing protein [Algibacter sp.]MDG1731291.1 T9SS type A sorting domain-containing protein [Algibacter sp.]MDG2178289.1 T9SS type A sorting domain-containing protein [Algibacter sp.]